MDHPNSDWIDWEKYNVKSDYDLDLHIRFRGLKARDADDHEKCLRWEINRTRLFKDNTFKPSNPIWFPFYVGSFPEKPYLAHDYKTRSEWTYFEGVKDDTEDLFKEDHGTNYEVDMGFYKGKIHRERVSVSLNIDPRWNLEKLISLVRKQSGEVFNRVEKGKLELEKDGFVFLKKHGDPKSISTLKRNLKALSHYRIGECMTLGWSKERFMKIFGAGTYGTEKSYRENILKYVKI